MWDISVEQHHEMQNDDNTISSSPQNEAKKNLKQELEKSKMCCTYQKSDIYLL